MKRHECTHKLNQKCFRDTNNNNNNNNTPVNSCVQQEGLRMLCVHVCMHACVRVEESTDRHNVLLSERCTHKSLS